MNRGSTVGECGILGFMDGFNEAPIHESGKSRAVWIGPYSEMSLLQ